MISFSFTPPFLRSIPAVMQPFVRAGKVDEIFRPRILPNGIFATATGYGVSFSFHGIDSEGLDRITLDYVSKQVAIANRTLPEDCVAYEYLVTAVADSLPARLIVDPLVTRQAQERSDFLKENAHFRTVRLIVTLYIPGTVSKDAREFTEKSRAALRQIQATALLYEQQLRIAGIKRLSPDELVQFYSYLLNLDRTLMTRHAAKPGQATKRLGRVHIGLEGNYLRVGKQYCQVLALVEPPRGTRPDLWGGLLPIIATWSGVRCGSAGRGSRHAAKR